MENYRLYGTNPYRVAVIHGGPGAPGSMAPVARKLSHIAGVIEPMQQAYSVKAQIRELKHLLQDHADCPVVLIGHSWGAMLGYIFTATNPGLVKKLIMVGSGVYEPAYAQELVETRLERLDENERKLFYHLAAELSDPEVSNKDSIMSKMGRLLTRIDSYSPLTLTTEEATVNYEQFKAVWDDAEKMRQTGELLSLGRHIKCPVLAIHGDYDPHPVEGIKKPLQSVIKTFDFVLLEKCGHFPWMEKEARQPFFDLIEKQIA